MARGRYRKAMRSSYKSRGSRNARRRGKRGMSNYYKASRGGVRM